MKNLALQLLLSMKDQSELIMVINSEDIKGNNKFFNFNSWDFLRIKSLEIFRPIEISLELYLNLIFETSESSNLTRIPASLSAS